MDRQSLIDFVFISKKSLFKGKVLSIIFRTDTDFDVQSATESLNFKSILKKHGLLILYYEHLPFERQVTNQPYSYIEMLPHQAVYFREVNAFEKWMQYWKGISVQNINQSLNQTVSYKENFLRETEYRLKKTAYAPEFEVIKAADLRKHLVNILLPFQKYLLYEGSQLQLLSNTEVLHFLYDNHRLFRQCVEEESPNALESLLLLISFNTENPQTYVPDTIPFLKCSKILSFLVWILVVDAPVGYKKKCKNALKSYHSFLEYQQGKRDALENETQQAKVKTLVVQSILKVTTVYGLCCLGSKSITVTGSVNPLMHESGHELLLLLIAPKITGELEDRIRNSIAVASNNSIKVTFILLKQNSVGKHFSYYHNFFENTILNTETAQVWQPIALKNNTLMLDAMRHNLK